MSRSSSLRNYALTLVILTAMFGGSLSLPARAEGDDGDRTARHPHTGELIFLGFDRGSAVRLGSEEAVASMLRPELAKTALGRYGADFGVDDPDRELQLLRPPDGDRAGSVRYQQLYKGVPVVAGELLVNLDDRGNLRAIVGEISPELDLSVEPELTAEQAKGRALAITAREHAVDEGDLIASEGELWIYDERLLRPSERPAGLVWRFEVGLDRLGPVRQLVLVDARRGNVVLTFNQIDTAKDRTVYDNNNDDTLGLPGGGPYRTEGDPASGITDVDHAYELSGDTYDFYQSHHGRDSIDDGGMEIISTTRYCHPLYPCPFANAFWNGSQMVYGEGFASADDVVAHELTHGVTQNESNLFYYYQSGAINESLSDVWGEFVDQVNGFGDDSPGVKWLMGEDVPGYGAIRDMSDPTVFGDPDKMTSSNYYLGQGDNGGVHYNSGVNNKAVYLMTDGGSFNGQTISPLGITKVAAIYYEVQTNLLTSGADYFTLYVSLYQACQNLVGGAEGITEADCIEVWQATQAVEMDEQPVADFNTDAAFCPPDEFPVFVFHDDFEGTPVDWASGAFVGSDRWWYGSPGGPYATSGEFSLYADDEPAEITDTYVHIVPQVMVPPNGYLHFSHAYGFDDSAGTYYDGGVLEYTINDGASWQDAGSMIEVNGYDGTLDTTESNPLGGREGFGADSHGYISSRVDLSSLEGEDVRFRWRMGLGHSFADWGWWLDDVTIYGCASDVLHLPLISK